eukprot:1150046-Pelagomonas_calceolata.AAC.4
MALSVSIVPQFNRPSWIAAAAAAGADCAFDAAAGLGPSCVATAAAGLEDSMQPRQSSSYQAPNGLCCFAC